MISATRSFTRSTFRWVLFPFQRVTFCGTGAFALIKKQNCCCCRCCTPWPMLSDELDSKPEVSHPLHSFIHFKRLMVLSSDCTRTRTKRFFFSPLSPPQLLVQFVQNASIPLVQSLEDSDSKHSCLPLLAPAENSLCSHLELTGPWLSAS